MFKYRYIPPYGKRHWSCFLHINHKSFHDREKNPSSTFTLLIILPMNNFIKQVFLVCFKKQDSCEPFGKKLPSQKSSVKLSFNCSLTLTSQKHCTLLESCYMKSRHFLNFLLTEITVSDKAFSNLFFFFFFVVGEFVVFCSLPDEKYVGL